MIEWDLVARLTVVFLGLMCLGGIVFAIVFILGWLMQSNRWRNTNE